ncbi:outer membrane beta-barrel protein [Flavobacterium chungangensis]|uniref:Outer membrane beta-barrel protein n=1 Tax=Flavobacterium chungangensis TaxID=2708132 RepID=A0ABV8ZHM1_9FLAO
MTKYYVMDKLSLEAGPQIGLLLSTKGRYEGRSFEYSFSGNGNLGDLSEVVDFGINIGAGYDFTKHISAGARYNFGLTNVFHGINTVHYRVLSLSAGYKF